MGWRLRAGRTLACLTGVLGAGACGFPDFAVSELDAGGQAGEAGDASAVDGDGAGGCQSHAECTSTPATPFCDSKQGVCVRCLPDQSACPAGTYCDSAGECQLGCASSDDCGVLTCDIATHVCTGCTADEQCPSGTLCDVTTTKCVAGCTTAHPCPGKYECCDGICADLVSDEAHCGACTAPCVPDNASGACQNGTCRIAECDFGFSDCDGSSANGCEANLLGDPSHCGGCTTTCGATTPDCFKGTCVPAGPCSPDGWEPNEEIQAPDPPPLPASMKPLDAADNVWKLSAKRTSTYTPGFTTAADVDVFYIDVVDDASGADAGFSIALEDIPSGATYRVDSYYHCYSEGLKVYGAECFPPPLGNNPASGSVGSWWWCRHDAAAPSLSYSSGHDCVGPDESGILQIRIRVLLAPTAATCAPYKLTVSVFPL
jgi:hypothetical protein